MPLLRPHRALLVALVLAVAACGGGDGDGDDRGDGPTTTAPDDGGPTTLPPDEGEVVPSEVVVLAEGADADPEGAGPGLLVDGTDLRAFAGRFLVPGSEDDEEVRDLADEVDDDGPGEVAWVGDVVGTGCFTPGGVGLRRVDDDVRLVPVDLPEDEGEVECTRAVITVALVAVDRELLPDDPTLAGEPADAPVGPGEVVGFAPLEPGARTDAVEVTTLAQLVTFLEDLDGAPTDLDLDEVEPDSRRFAFVVEGCAAATAELVLDAESIVAVPKQEGEERGEQVECESLEPYLVVADVPVSASGGVLPDEG
jgi:hypothetical protein